MVRKKPWETAPEAERGAIYRCTYAASDGEGYVLILSAPHRKGGKYQSGIYLSDAEKQRIVAPDELGVTVDGHPYWIHPNMVCYIRRDKLREKAGVASDALMENLEAAVMRELGISDYKERYEMLLDAAAKEAAR